MIRQPPLEIRPADAASPAVMLHPFLPERLGTRCGVLILPGGGYGHLSTEKEGTAVGEWLASHGIVSAMLEYRLAPARHPAPLDDARLALRTLRVLSPEWGVDPGRVGVLGFSAGGHLAATLCTHFDRGSPASPDPRLRESCRPDFAILLYPVITLHPPHHHGGSRGNLLGPSPDPALLDELSAERRVTPQTPPAFLFHTGEDKTVPPENSVLYWQALRAAGVPAELHIFTPGGHGCGLAQAHPSLSAWPDLAVRWLRGLGFLEPS